MRRSEVIGLAAAALSTTRSAKVGPAVDGAASRKPGQFKNSTFEQIARKMLAPFGVTLKLVR